MPDPAYELTAHAKTVVEERGIRLDWLERVLLNPDSKIEESQEVQPGIVLDFNAEKQVVAIEVLRLKARFPSADAKRLHVEIA